MIGITGCGENKNSREWIENKVSEVSRVYPHPVNPIMINPPKSKYCEKRCVFS